MIFDIDHTHNFPERRKLRKLTVLNEKNRHKWGELWGKPSEVGMVLLLLLTAHLFVSLFKINK